jgi:hypothetical protein
MSTAPRPTPGSGATLLLVLRAPGALRHPCTVYTACFCTVTWRKRSPEHSRLSGEIDMPTTAGARQGSAPVALQLKAREVKDARKGVELVVQGPAPTEL